jgi:hypothetical protein
MDSDAPPSIAGLETIGAPTSRLGFRCILRDTSGAPG